MPRTKKILLDLANLGHKVTYIPLTDTATHGATVKELQLHGIEIFHGHFDLESLFQERHGLYDTIMVCKPHHAEPMLWRMRKHFPKAHLIYDTEAIIFQRELVKTTKPKARVGKRFYPKIRKEKSVNALSVDLRFYSVNQ